MYEVAIVPATGCAFAGLLIGLHYFSVSELGQKFLLSSQLYEHNDHARE